MNPAIRSSLRIAACAAAILCLLATGHLPLSAFHTQPTTAGDLPPSAKNDQNPADQTISPLDALRRITVPQGFQVTLFAGEPDVAQPIAATFDDRGRLWVAECYSHPHWKETGHDRILIFEDTNGDGRFNKRKIFWDQGRYLTGLLYGHGGVWICNTPSLMFIPDRNGDDIPDGPPEEHLDGFVRNNPSNVLNNLNWGPDGWLYGCIGNSAISSVGKPGTPAAERTKIAQGIWRYHPTRHTFEIVARGAVNPWGLDFNDVGEGFFTNCVLGHLWHLLPGAYYQRRSGERGNPYAYSRIGPIADHLHWGGGEWTSSRGGQGVHNTAGGGHAHTGAMIYLGDNWPERYRDTFFTGNLHGNRLNNDILRRKGSGYVGHHGKDFLLAHHDWFRCLWQKVGPDGGAVIGDWHDYGECHDSDGTHRTSGRIYKIVYGTPRPAAPFDLAKQSDVQLVELQRHKNDWYVRHARRLLHERAIAGGDLSQANDLLRRMLKNETTVERKLRALWALNLTGGLTDKLLIKVLSNNNEHLRAWAIRLLCDFGTPPRKAIDTFAQMATGDPSPLVRLYLATALQRLPLSGRWAIASGLIAHGEDTPDHALPHMIWYGIEPLAESSPPRFTGLIAQTRIPLLRQHMARRLAEAGHLDPLLVLLGGLSDPIAQQDILDGMYEALRGRKNIPAPKLWSVVQSKLSGSDRSGVSDRVLQLATLFGDAKAIALLQANMLDAQSPLDQRRRSLNSLVELQAAGLAPKLHQLLGDGNLQHAAILGLAAFDDPATPEQLLSRFKSFGPSSRQAAIATLSSRRSYARALLDAITAGSVARTDVSAFNARQIANLGDARLTSRLQSIWGDIRPTGRDKRKLIAKHKGMLSSQALKRADLSNGRAIFDKTCAKCHRLFGSGGTIGPDLTGSNRANLDYILENIIDPSAVVGKDFRMVVLATTDGRVISGMLAEKTDNRIKIQTVEKLMIVAVEEIDQLRTSQLSMMPEGQLEKMNQKTIRDLIGYLATPKQVALPKTPE